MAFVRFMESAVGRLVRVVVGLVLMAVGLLLGGPWLVLVAVGLLPIATGVLNVCLIAPLFHAPIRHVTHGR